jgi:hypothetical protein
MLKHLQPILRRRKRSSFAPKDATVDRREKLLQRWRAPLPRRRQRAYASLRDGPPCWLALAVRAGWRCRLPKRHKSLTREGAIGSANRLRTVHAKIDSPHLRINVWLLLKQEKNRAGFGRALRVILTWGASGQGGDSFMRPPARLVGSVSTIRSLSASVDISPFALGSENGERETKLAVKSEWRIGQHPIDSVHIFTFQYPGPEPNCLTRPVSGHDQPHIRSPLETAAPTSRLRRAGAQANETILPIGISVHGLPRFVHPDPPELIRSWKICESAERLSSGGLHHGSLNDDASGDIFPQRHQQLSRQRHDSRLLHAAAVAFDPFFEPQSQRRLRLMA